MQCLARIGWLAALVLCTGFVGAQAFAQDFLSATDYVTWNVSVAPEEVASGEAFEAVIEADISEGWKMYALDSPRPSFAVEFTWEEEGLLPAGPMRQSTPVEAHDPWFDATVRYFTGQARFTAPFRIGEDAPAGNRPLNGVVQFMICTEEVCLPPTPAPLEAVVHVIGGGLAVQGSVSGAGAVVGDEGNDSLRSVPDLAGDSAPLVLSPDSATEDDGDAHAGGLWRFILLAIGAGLASLLTPCVFPMIPLTVSWFSRHASKRSESVRMALAFGAAIVLTFTTLGLLAASLLGAAGAHTIAANPWINLFIAGIFAVFAFSLLGMFELTLPGRFVNYFNRQGNERSGYAGTFFMGLTLTLVHFSCTVPFVGGLLALATATGEWVYPVIGMVVFSATFAVPFVAFALFPKALQSLPGAGSWIHRIQVTLGFVELAAALKFLSNADLVMGWGLISRPVAIALAMVIFGLAGFYLLGKIRMPHEPAAQPVGAGRLLFASAFLGISLYMLPGLFGAPLPGIDAWLPPASATQTGSGVFSGRADDEPVWSEDIDAAFEQAQSAGKPVFIDFTGYTCANCRQMETSVFREEPVASLLRNDFVLLRLYTDARDTGPALQQYQIALAGTVALPTYVIADPYSGILLHRHTGIASVSEFAEFLRQGAAFEADAPAAFLPGSS
ncbi:MAG: DUF255 domain-containing protein [Bacteroidetes bacterium SB0662_bin_6]|nr:DUF255 domain-containing protein [Bacteroidetes bacterium SB0668_bin_1]MYE03863.1 DUF255 domain-containing protein [Bacteroidetes bacterium SB0662_bin_6]